jgi:mono/diheme cytochrome c family protein
MAETGPVDAAAEAFTNPLPADRATIGHGRALYEMYCIPCHGTDGAGTGGAVAKFFPRVGDLGSIDVQQHGDGWLYAIITNGTPMMPAYGHELDARERWQVARFVRTFAR